MKNQLQWYFSPVQESTLIYSFIYKSLYFKFQKLQLLAVKQACYDSLHSILPLWQYNKSLYQPNKHTFWWDCLLRKILHATANIRHSQININIQTKTQLHDGGIWERYREQNNWSTTSVLLREIHWRNGLMVVEMSKYDIYWEAGRLGWKLKQ